MCCHDRSIVAWRIAAVPSAAASFRNAVEEEEGDLNDAKTKNDRQPDGLVHFSPLYLFVIFFGGKF